MGKKLKGGCFFLGTLIFPAALMALGLIPFQPAMAAAVTTSAQYQAVPVGSYIVQTDYWNKEQCPGEQSLEIDDQTGAFTLTKTTYHCSPTVAAYPSIIYGCAFGECSPQNDLPAPVSALACVKSDWSFRPPDSGAWDVAYDIWVCPDNHCGPSGFNGGAEVMIWPDYQGAHGWQYDMGSVTIGGLGWEVWQFDGKAGDSQWKYVAYLAQNPFTSVKNLESRNS